MGKEKAPHNFINLKALAVVFCAAAAVAFAPAANASPTEARSLDVKEPIIEALRVNQMGSNQILLELRGTLIPVPRAVSRDCAIALQFDGARFPRDTDRKDWWEDFEWEILKVNLEKSEEWKQHYDLPLFQELRVMSGDAGGIVMEVTGDKPLTVKQIHGMPRSSRLRLVLEAKEEDIAPILAKPPRVAPKNDPLAIKTPVTLDLRDVSVRELFSMLAKIQDLNLVLDSSVPSTLMTISFNKTAFGEVFAYLLRMNDLTYSLMGKTLIVGTADNIGKTLGQNVTKEYKIAYADVAKLSPIIMGLVPLPKPPVVDDRLRALYITATPDQHRLIEALMNRIDHPGKQVMIEARLIEINDGAEQDVEAILTAVYRGWLFSYSGSSGLSSQYTYGNYYNSNLSSESESSGWLPNLLPNEEIEMGEFPILGGTEDTTIPVNLADSAMKMLDAGLRAMESDNKGKVLASPSVVALDGEKATVKLTHNYLYQSGVDDNGNPEFEEEETGPTLEFTPTLGRDGFLTIQMKIATGEIVSFRQSGDSETPETTKREVETSVRVRNGEIFVIGGLYQENKTNNVTRVPVLGYIPLLGELFKTRNSSHTKSQVAFIAIPYILDIPTGAAEVLDMPSAGLYQ